MAAYDITALSSALTTDFRNNSSVYLPGTDFVVVGYEKSLSVYLRAYSVNRSTGVLTALGSAVYVSNCFDAISFPISVVAIDSSNVAIFWQNTSDENGKCALYSVDGSGNITLNGSAIDFESGKGSYIQSILWDTTHFLTTWTNSAGAGKSQIISFDTSAGTITPIGSQFQFSSFASKKCLIKISSTKAVVFYDTVAIVLNVNNSTYEVTSPTGQSTGLTTHSIDGSGLCILDDSSSVVEVSMLYYDRTDYRVYIGSFKIDTTTDVITTFGNKLSLGTGSYMRLQNSINKVINNTVIVFHRDFSASSEEIQTLSYNNSTGDFIVEDSISITGGDCFSSIGIGDDIFIGSWETKIQAFSVELPTSGPANLKSYNTNLKANIKTINTNPIANVKSLNTNV